MNRRKVRSYRPQDFDVLARLHEEAEAFDRAGRPMSRAALAERMGYPGFEPEKDLFLIESQRRVIGFAQVTREPRIGRVILEGLIHPEHRRQGAGAALLSAVLRQNEEQWVGAAHVGVCKGNEPARRLLSRSGFSRVRRHLELELDLREVPPGVSETSGIALRWMTPDQIPALADLQNRAFAGSWGYQPNTAEEIEYRLCRVRCFEERVLLALEAGRPVGFCWTTRPREQGPVPAARRGRVHMIGVDPSARNRGVAKVALQAALCDLEQRGSRWVDLTVDSHNAAALSVYRVAGFRTRLATVWYERISEPRSRGGSRRS